METTKFIKTHRLQKSKSGKLSLIPILRFRHEHRVYETDIPQDVPNVKSYFAGWKELCINKGAFSLAFYISIKNAN